MAKQKQSHISEIKGEGVFWNTIKTEEKTKKSSSQYYWSDGQITDNAQRDTKSTLCAKLISNKEQNTENLYILSDGGELFNPQNISTRYNRKNWKFRIAKNRESFDLYLAFLGFRDENLKGKKTTILKAERMI